MTIHAYQRNKTNGVCATEMIALLLEKTAYHITQVLQAMTQEDYEQRNAHSMMAQDILKGLEQHLPDLNLSSQEAIQALRMYYHDTCILITRMNIKNDAHSAAALLKSLRSSAEMWRQIKQKAHPLNNTGGMADQRMAVRA